ncbi:unnamed protein product [Phytophthora lilii]|uniref:Unnamed protein product n=1 Tax=Phytophthora lilii TaxID=2077276 RepID=A0A9W6WH79_9STRA|nr:unnamed protein product [Phytophthora lilii]
MMDAEEVPTLLSEGLLSVLYHMLQSTAEFPRCAAAHAIKHLVPAGYDPDVTIDVPPYLVDDHEELFLNSSLSDLQFLVKGHIAPINAHKVVLFFRNSYFKNMVRVSIVCMSFCPSMLRVLACVRCQVAKWTCLRDAVWFGNQSDGRDRG